MRGKRLRHAPKLIGNRFARPEGQPSYHQRYIANRERSNYSLHQSIRGFAPQWRGDVYGSKYFADPETPLDWLLAKEAVEERGDETCDS